MSSIKEVLLNYRAELRNNFKSNDESLDRALAEIKRIIEEAKPNVDNSQPTNRELSWKKDGINEYHNNLLKVLGE